MANIVAHMQSQGVSHRLLYCSGVTLYAESGEAQAFNLLSIASGRSLRDWNIIISPLYRFRRVVPLFWRRPVTFYVADSILKTSMHAFANNPLLIHRVVYAAAIEKLMRRHSLIVASLEELTWFTSSGHPNDHIFLVPPVPAARDGAERAPAATEDRVFVFNPSGRGVEPTIDIVGRLLRESETCKVVISGRDAARVVQAVGPNQRLVSLAFVEDIDALIASSRVVLLTDVGGTGLCNRSVHVRALGRPLVCTPDSVRGSSLLFDPGVHPYSDAEEAVDLLLAGLQQSHNVHSTAVDDLTRLFDKSMRRFVAKCFPA